MCTQLVSYLHTYICFDPATVIGSIVRLSNHIHKHINAWWSHCSTSPACDVSACHFWPCGPPQVYKHTWWPQLLNMSISHEQVILSFHLNLHHSWSQLEYEWVWYKIMENKRLCQGILTWVPPNLNKSQSISVCLCTYGLSIVNVLLYFAVVDTPFNDS